MNGTHIVFDIGGTNMRIASAKGGELGEIEKVPTPQDLTETVKTLVRIARELASDIERAAGCIPGQIDAERGVYDANNRKHWAGRHFDAELSRELGVPVTVANDAAVVGLGEFYTGAGRGASRMAYVTISTGVGAALIVDGAIEPTVGFYFGHVTVEGEELENLVSGTAVTKKFGIHPKDLDSIDERNRLADILAQGLVRVIEAWSPDTIVFGGSMIVGVNPIPLERVRTKLAELVTHPPAVKMAELGDNGGLHGALFLAKNMAAKAIQ